MSEYIFHQDIKPINETTLKQTIGHNVLIVYHRPDASGRKCGYWNMLCYVKTVYREYIFVEWRGGRRWKLWVDYIMEVEFRD